MTQEEIQQLEGEGIEIRHWFDDRLDEEEWEKLNRLIEIELELEDNCNK